MVMQALFITFFCLQALSSECPLSPTIDKTQLALPYPSLPDATLTLPTLNDSTHVLVVGGRGISAAIANLFCKLGARVSITTRNIATYWPQGIPSCNTITTNIFELEYGAVGESSPRSFVRRYIDVMGRNPDYIIDCGIPIYAGNSVDFTDEEMAYMSAAYIWGSIALEAAFLRYNDPIQKVVHSTCLSTAGLSAPPYFQEFYNTGKQMKIQHILGQNAAQLHPNWRYVGVACTNTNTTWYETAQNPSAVRGDKAQVAFNAALKYATLAIGTPPETVALAHAQAMLLPMELNNETIFTVSPLSGDAGTMAFYALKTFLSGKEYVEAYQKMVLEAFHINITDH
jgi:hypothetical protein